jgi:uncharacterized protein YggE
MTVPATDLKDINQKLEAFRKARPANVQAIRYQTNLRASDTAVDDARQRLLTQLLADARKRATTLAAAVGLKLGAVVSVSDSAYSNGVTPQWINSYSFSSGGSSGDSGGPQVTFSMYVKFAAN